MEHQMLKTNEVAKLLRVTDARIYQLIKSGHLREGVHFYRPNGLTMRWDGEAISNYLHPEPTIDWITPNNKINPKLMGGANGCEDQP